MNLPLHKRLHVVYTNACCFIKGVSLYSDQAQWSEIEGTDYFTLITDSLVSLMHHDPSDFGSLTLIQMTPKEYSQKFNRQLFVAVVVLQLSSQQDFLE